MEDFSDKPERKDEETPRSTPLWQQLTPKKSLSAPPAIRRIILELSLRFQPTDEARREAFNEKVALLVLDCATVPPEWLEKATESWIRSGDGFLPSAAVLIKLAQEAQRSLVPAVPAGENHRVWVERCAQWNIENRLSDIPNKQRNRWVPSQTGYQAEPMDVDQFERSYKSAIQSRTEGKPYERRFIDVIDEMRRLGQRPA